jgi:signal transduction histidine kinase
VTTRGFRLALIAGFGGILFIFLVAAVDAIRLLNHMRAENEVLREASLERSRRLASIRTYILLCDRTPDHSDELHDALAQVLDNLAGYRSSTLDETMRLSQLRNLLERHWTSMQQAEPSAARTTVLEISSRVEDVDSRQLASTVNAIRDQFEDMGQRLSQALIIALCAALALACACLVYIARIERQDRGRYLEVLQARGALEQLSARLVEAQETERRSISRELHDEVGQTLGAVLVDAANLANRIPKEDTVSHRYLDSIRALSDASMSAIRNIALLLRPSMLDDLGLVPALEWQAREVSRRSGIKVKVTAEDVSDSLPDTLRTCVYRVVQEALHNVSRHSKASSVVVDVRQTDVGRTKNTLTLTVQDDGAGFDPATTKGLGLLGMEERVRQLGGRLEIQSQPRKGTALRVTLPLLNNPSANGVQN